MNRAQFVGMLTFGSLMIAPTYSFGQVQSVIEAYNSDSAGASSSAEVASVVTAEPKPLTERWLDLKTLSYSGRYRDTVNLHGRRLFQFGQERYLAVANLKADEQGRYSLHVRMSTGRYFNWSYADFDGGQYKDSVVAARAYKTPAETAALKQATALDPNGAVYAAGIPSRGGYFYPREFYVNATPVSQVTFQVGSLAIDHGQNTEITSFDDDGYISGERVVLQDSKHLYFDRIGLTWAYLGSPLTPNFFSRAGDMTQSNYAQYLVEKQFTKKMTASVDYTLANHTHTMREAVAVKTPMAMSKWVDSGRVELYQRMNDVAISGINFTAGSGAAFSLHNTSFHKRLSAEAGFANIDERYAVYGGSIYLATVGFAWNGDNYETGKRAFGKAEVKLGHGVSAFGFYTHATTPITIGHNQQGWTSGLSVDLKTIANSGPKVF